MGNHFKYFDHTLRSIQEIEIMTEKALNGISGYVPFKAGDDEVSAELKRISELPRLTDIEGVTITSITISGTLPNKVDAYQVFADILHKGINTYGAYGVISNSVNYEEINSQQTATRASSISVGVRNGRYEFALFDTQSKVAKDKIYAREYIDCLIKNTNIPIKTINHPEGYNIIHNTNGWTWGTESVNSTVFACELPILSVEEMINILRNGVMVSAKKIFKNEWYIASIRLVTKPEEIVKMYNQLLADAFPAQHYDIIFFLKLESLSAIDALRFLCKGKGKFDSEIGAFPLPDKNYAWVNVVSTTDGHYIELETLSPIDNLDDINSMLGLDLRDASSC
jgi:hypothetical protein